MAIREPIVLPQETSEARLERTWGRPRGFWGWFMNVHHTAIGVRYMVTHLFSSCSVACSRGDAPSTRPARKPRPRPGLYNQIFTMHGSDDDVSVRRADDVEALGCISCR